MTLFFKSVQGQENISFQTQELINKYQPFKPEKKRCQNFSN